MPQFTEEQLKELEQVFDLKRKATIKVRDGYVCPDDMVWWRGEGACEHVKANDPSHARNIQKYPNRYQICKPRMRVEYMD